MKRILITGGSGYIGSHVALELYNRGQRYLTNIDFNVKGSPNSEATSHMWEKVYESDLAGIIGPMSQELENAEPYDVIVHLAAYISVEESVKDPTKYWFNNMASTGTVIRLAQQWGSKLYFASTGTAFDPNNPYAETKVECENLIDEFKVPGAKFRFYNVSGYADGLKPTGPSTHLIRRLAEGLKQDPSIATVFGNDWDTRDGTCIRDYIHVKDLAASIANAIESDFVSERKFECLGSGDGFSVEEVIGAMECVSDKSINVTYAPRREGDVASMVCPRSLMYKDIVLEHTLQDMCRSAMENV